MNNATAGQFLLFLFIVIQALSESFGVWEYAGFHQEVDRRKRCTAGSVVLDATSRFHFIRVLFHAFTD